METLKHCPICLNDLPISEFGICRARRDGRNLYCKSCIRVKVAKSRRILKEYKASRKRYAEQQKQIVESELLQDAPLSIYKLAPVDRVREAIRKGSRTQKEIAVETRLNKDEVGDALTSLVLWTREVTTEGSDETRRYFLREEPQLERKPNVISPSLWAVANQVGPLVKGEKSIQRVA